jgi:hypothetical protein
MNIMGLSVIYADLRAHRAGSVGKSLVKMGVWGKLESVVRGSPQT